MMSALSASGRFDPKVLFTKWFGGEPESDSDPDDDADDAGVATNDAETDFDYSGVQWQLPSDGDAEALAQLNQVMSSNAQTGVNDLEDQPEDQGFPTDFTPDDREWV